MSTIQNLKNFIRHGKQARAPNAPLADPTTTVSPVHAHPQQSRFQNQAHALTDPDGLVTHQPPQVAGGDYSAANVDARNVAAKAGGAAAKAQGGQQRIYDGAVDDRSKAYDASVLERIVAEERESKGKLPKYPGLERWTLLEKMGDGAFSNVYRARDTTGQMEEVAIKVVRKFEMSSNQVST